MIITLSPTKSIARMEIGKEAHIIQNILRAYDNVSLNLIHTGVRKTRQRTRANGFAMFEFSKIKCTKSSVIIILQNVDCTRTPTTNQLAVPD